MPLASMLLAHKQKLNSNTPYKQKPRKYPGLFYFCADHFLLQCSESDLKHPSGTTASGRGFICVAIKWSSPGVFSPSKKLVAVTHN